MLKKRRNIKNSKNGFILLEAMVAIVVLSIVLVICIQSMIYFIRVSKKAEQLNDLSLVAQDSLSDLTQNSYASEFGMLNAITNNQYNKNFKSEFKKVYEEKYKKIYSLKLSKNEKFEIIMEKK